MAAKVSGGEGGGSASEEVYCPLPISAEAGGSGELFIAVFKTNNNQRVETIL